MIFPQSLFGVKRVEGDCLYLVVYGKNWAEWKSRYTINGIAKVDNEYGVISHIKRIREIIEESDVAIINAIINKDGVFVYSLKDSIDNNIARKFNRVFDFGFNWCPVVVPYSEFNSEEDLHIASEVEFAKSDTKAIFFYNLEGVRVYTIKRYSCKRLFYYYKARLSKFKDYLFKTDKH